MKSSTEFKTLDKLKIGQDATVLEVSCNNSELRQKLLSLGIVKNTVIKVLKISPLGDPISILIRGFELALRKSEAHAIKLVR